MLHPIVGRFPHLRRWTATDRYELVWRCDVNENLASSDTKTSGESMILPKAAPMTPDDESNHIALQGEFFPRTWPLSLCDFS
jgi:hypothetical protein